MAASGAGELSSATWRIAPMFGAIAMAFSLVGSGLAQPGAEGTMQVEDLEVLSWLIGTWGDEQTLEHWTDGAGGLMLGVHRDLRNGRASFFEFLRIALGRDGGVVYLASPAGRHPPTVFTMTEVGENRVVFTNPDHDYPQRIDYALEEGDLVVTISKADQSDQRTWRWRRLDQEP